MIERHGCVRKNLMPFSTAGKRHKHPVVLALYHDLLRRIGRKEVVLGKPLSIVDSVMPPRRAWRGVGGEVERIETRKRFTMLVIFTAWKWSLSKTSPCVTKKKKNRYMCIHDPCIRVTLIRTYSN